MRISSTLGVGWMLIAAVAVPSLRAQDADAAAQLRSLLGDYRKAAADPAQRRAVVDRAIALGEAGKAKLLGQVERELKSLQRQYQSRFGNAALKLGARLRAKARLEAEKHREAVLELSRGGEPSKAAIESKGDPAIKALLEMHRPTRDAVLESSQSLKQIADDLAARLEDHGRLVGGEAGADGTMAQQEQLALHLAFAANRNEIKILSENHKLLADLDPEEARGMRYLNQIRLVLGLSALRVDTKLCDAARDHSKDMVEKKFFSHTSPVPGKRTFTDRARNFGVSASAENIALGSKTGHGAIMQWWHSPGHFVNMLNPGHMRQALGRHANHWTQMFGR